MTWAINEPRAVASRPSRVATRPSGMALVGLAVVLVGAWAGIVGFVGPLFGYHATAVGAWEWTRVNWLLHLVPGAVAVFAGLVVLADSPRLRAVTRGSFGFAGLLSILAGAWLVIGPAASPVFEAARAYGPSSGAMAALVNEVGANLGPGLLLAALGGMALKALARDRSVELPAATATPLSAAEPVARTETVPAARQPEPPTD